ncbi:hypothetical protein A1342_17105 [Methylomonas methanica]|uniref:Uncharacterized protein n=1 Tax=Methylomonas denitrificans TaxID=1538553 RepID=A0A126T1M1_9GAMM|nr:hypothetical protein JT25_005670 [Methylomonas denitrificans]OAH99883.1 hypothetical protein A1342_17105 [Methylomonas methanica]
MPVPSGIYKAFNVVIYMKVIDANFTLLVFRAGFNVYHFTLPRLNGDIDRSTADAAVFNILLTLNRTIHQNLDCFPAIRTLNNRGFEVVHDFIR